MRLESIKLAGFKSFVDPTTVTFPSNLTAIVGPNGCGKSNIIDGIRWVMGESSAKQLRGQSLEDVIFNGCKTRKPLGKASIELNFDNSEGKLGGQYSTYAQISIRREITRDGQSIYSLNGSRCRRRDIRDIFLGTGLGPRSYAIIEQGMIATIVEAKPDALRAYVEEAAGISKYKERRRETELRLEHTQENLNRLNDLREELTKQRKHLQRQANAAERYKALKQEERLLKARLLTLRYQALHDQLASQLTLIQVEEKQLNEAQRAQQILLQQITKNRDQQTEARLQCDASQTHYYELGNEITRLEENLHIQTTQLKQNEYEQTNLEKTKTTLEQQIRECQITHAHLKQEIAERNKERDAIQDTLEQSEASLKQAELALKNWQIGWEKSQETFAQLKQQHHVSETQHQHYQQQDQSLRQRIQHLQQEQSEQNHILTDDNHITDLEQALTRSQQEQQICQAEQQQITQHIREQHASLQQLSKNLDDYKSQWQTSQGKYASLIALQEAALGKQEQTLLQWLKKHNLTEQPRLAQLLQVETGWERAVEVALNQHIQAICLTDSEDLNDFLKDHPPSSISLMKKTKPCDHATLSLQSHLPLLSSKLTASWPLEHLLAGIYAAETTAQALDYIQQLKDGESIITREGTCLGSHWIRLTADNDNQIGLLQREREITLLKKTQQAIQAHIDKQQADYSQTQQQLKALEEQQLEKQKQGAALLSYQADLNTRQQVQQVRLAQAEQQTQRLQQALQEATQQQGITEEKLQQIKHTQKKLHIELAHIEKQRQSLLESKAMVQTHYDEAIKKTKAYESQSHQLELHLQAVNHQLKTTEATSLRLIQEQDDVSKRLLDLQQRLADAKNPMETIQQTLDAHLDQRNHLAHQLKENQARLQTIEQHYQQTAQAIQPLEKSLVQGRDSLEQQRLQSQELRIRAKTLEEQLNEQGYELHALLEELAMTENVDIAACEIQLKEVTDRIEHIGAVNLAALEEHHTVSEREKYLDTQYQDLLAALETLQTAIQKMDKETRHRFKETFDKVNQNFTALFPRLFSGGEASLQLQNPDLLTSGICIMAQPPGKRNSTIHLLSGGEKALTATALVFSLFQLNPAPFCMLDEVDAPLDDTNVLRFCKLVKEMSQEVQFIFISHNKVAIEMAQHLAGVTMHEPGVSRMVSVDVEKAIAMATT